MIRKVLQSQGECAVAFVERLRHLRGLNRVLPALVSQSSQLVSGVHGLHQLRVRQSHDISAARVRTVYSSMQWGCSV